MPRGHTASPVDRLLGPLQRFLSLEAASGILLLGAAAVAFAWANSGASCLAGIGFTMSLFIAGLAFGGGAHGGAAEPSLHLDAAKLGILGGPLLSGALGWALLARGR